MCGDGQSRGPRRDCQLVLHRNYTQNRFGMTDSFRATKVARKKRQKWWSHHIPLAYAVLISLFLVIYLCDICFVSAVRHCDSGEGIRILLIRGALPALSARSSSNYYSSG